jgi:hypothetical protein
VTYYENHKARLKKVREKQQSKLDKKAYDKAYRAGKKAERKLYFQDNKDKIAQQKKASNPIRTNQTKSWRNTNRSTLAAKQKERYHKDPLYRLKRNMINLIGLSFSDLGYRKN